MRFYSDPSRESDPYALSDCEVFFSHENDHTRDTVFWNDCDDEPYESGFYFWNCLPGCLPDSGPFGPFKTEAAAIEHARELA